MEELIRILEETTMKLDDLNDGIIETNLKLAALSGIKEKVVNICSDVS